MHNIHMFSHKNTFGNICFWVNKGFGQVYQKFKKKTEFERFLLTKIKSKSSKKNSKLLQNEGKLWYNEHTITEGQAWTGRRPIRAVPASVWN